MRRLTMMQAQWEAASETGETLRFDYCKGGYFSSEEEFGLRLAGKTEQKQLTGKNLFNIDAVEVISITNLNGEEVKRGGVVLECGEGTYSFSAQATREETYVFVTVIDSENRALRSPISNFITPYGFKRGSVTLSAGERFFVYDGWSRQNTVISRAIMEFCQIQVEEGDTATAFEPYCGGIPSPNPDYPQPIQCVKAGTMVRARGKNLYNIPEQVKSGVTLTHNANGEYVLNGTATKSDNMIALITLPEGTYTLSIGSDRIPTSIEDVFIQVYNSASKTGIRITTIKAVNDSKTARLTGGEHQLRIRLEGGVTYNNYTFRPQLEESDTETLYVPYVPPVEITTPCDLYEGDVWWPMSGKVERNSEIRIFDGSEPWRITTLYGDGTTRYYVSSESGIFSSVRDTGYCDTYIRVPYASVMANKTGECYALYGMSGIQVRSHYNSVEEFKNYLNQNNMTVVYRLATPVIEQYDPQPIHANIPVPPYGTVFVDQVPTELPGTLSATMAVRRVLYKREWFLLDGEIDAGVRVTGTAKKPLVVHRPSAEASVGNTEFEGMAHEAEAFPVVGESGLNAVSMEVSASMPEPQNAIAKADWALEIPMRAGAFQPEGRNAGGEIRTVVDPLCVHAEIFDGEVNYTEGEMGYTIELTAVAELDDGTA